MTAFEGAELLHGCNQPRPLFELRRSGALCANALLCFEVSLSPLGLAFFAVAGFTSGLFDCFGMELVRGGNFECRVSNVEYAWVTSFE
jgi:hypothetical protein